MNYDFYLVSSFVFSFTVLILMLLLSYRAMRRAETLERDDA